MKIFKPLKNTFITQGYGLENTAPSMLPLYKKMGLLGHNGWDFSAKDGQPIYWNCDIAGEVYQHHVDPAGGIGVDIITADEDGTIYKFRNWHLKKGTWIAPIGSRVETGDLICYADSTGRSTGPHDHFGLKPQIIDEQGNYHNKYQNNGYTGGIDPSPFYKDIFVGDYMSILQKKLSIIKKLIYLYKKLLGLKA